ncbi:MAG TPA: DUF3667 domain-containing protein [Sphingorhabdus sp.]|jgi:hypothetical protein|nr:DUF3667 domain-containing protein [Sphingorhabdus sp.]
MSGELAGAADIATGAVIARAVESDAGKDGHFHEGACLNCGAALTGPYCHQCGQQGHLHRTLTAFWHDLLHGVLHFEGKIWRTIPMLFFRPGELTRRYVHGERARFVSPLALFLFSVFFMFALFSVMGSGFDGSRLDGNTNAEISQGVERSKADLQKELDRIDGRIEKAEAAGESTAQLRRERANIGGMLRLVGGGPTVISENSEQILGFKTGWARLDKGIEKANANPGLLLYKLQTNAYKFSWMLIPISVPFVWMLFFWRFDLKMYDHAIFVTYSLCFMTLLATLATILMTLGAAGATLASLLFFVPPIHIYKQLRGAYQLSRFGAFIRMFLLTISATIVIVLFALLLIGLGLVG